MLYGGGYDKTYGLIAQDKRFAEPIMNRVMRTVERDKNNPSVYSGPWAMKQVMGLISRRQPG